MPPRILPQRGPPGADGADGTNGADGADGADGAPGPAGVLDRGGATQISNTSAGSTSLVTLGSCTTTFTSAGGVLEIIASFHVTAAVTDGAIEVQIDGARVSGCPAWVVSSLASLDRSIVLRAQPAAGSRTVRIAWKNGALGSISCNPTSSENYASLSVKEYP